VCKTEGLYNRKCVEWFIQNHSDDGLYDVSHYVKFHYAPCISKIMTCWNQIKYGNTVPQFAMKNPIDRLNQLEIWCDLKELLSVVQHFYIWPLYISLTPQNPNLGTTVILVQDMWLCDCNTDKLYCSSALHNLKRFITW
jgi:hypothetical protein